MFPVIQEVKNTLEEKGVKTTSEELEGISVLRATVNSKYCDYTFTFFSTGDQNELRIRIFNLVKGIEEQKSEILRYCNQLNYTYRYVRFYVDKEGSLVVAYDTLQSMDNPGGVAWEMMCRLMGMIKDVYPVFMRIMWGGATIER